MSEDASGAAAWRRFEQLLVGNPVMKDYQNDLSEAYFGELWGELFFEQLAACRTGVLRESAALATLAQLEREMRAALEPVLQTYGLNVDLSPRFDSAHEQAASLVRQLAGLPWRDLCCKLQALVAPYLLRYRELASVAPVEDQPILRLFVEHEEALFTFAACEAEASDADAIFHVRTVLNKLGRRDGR